MSIRFREIRPDEFEPMIGVFERHMTKDIVDSKQLPEEIAASIAKASIEENLPDGITTPEHSFRLVQADSRDIGYVWYRVHVDQDRAYIFFIYLFEEERRKGYGHEIMNRLEANFKNMGVVRIQLVVFGANLPARRLYEKSGMKVTEIEMSKWLN